ncbi:hypothetical protein BC831DRAFT_487650 [Entophlyctis helioformis]|nr:hypothetical protein BC831DRAFT_487650 [Entophlyctis helioformis]
MAANKVEERNQLATVYVGNIDDRATDALVWELFLQAGPVVNVYLPKDRVTQMAQGYGFVEFMTEEDADYAIKIMNMIKLYGKPLRVNKATSDKQTLDVGATLFVGNLDLAVDEKVLYDTFSAFGTIISTPKIARDPSTSASKGYGFVSFANFEASDAAIEAMNGQFLANRSITVSYALKKDGKGERHGTPAERLLAAQAGRAASGAQMPNRMFADIPPPNMPFGAGPPPAFAPSFAPPPGFVPPPMAPMGAPPGYGVHPPPPQWGTPTGR